MIITIKCDCGNEVIIPAPAGKYTQFRDNLAAKKFHFGATKIKNEVLKEIIIECDMCRKQITLGVD